MNTAIDLLCGYNLPKYEENKETHIHETTKTA